MWWTRQRRRGRWMQGEATREQFTSRRTYGAERTAKPCGSGTRGWCQAAGGEVDPTGSISHQAGSDGGKRNSSPGRARHKPSNHCAGNAGVLRLYLYARVRISLHHAHGTAGAACTRHSLHPLISGVKPASPGRHAPRERRPVFGFRGNPRLTREPPAIRKSLQNEWQR